MDKNTIYEAAYETIKDSTGWGEEHKNYGTYILGVIDMTDKLLEKLDEEELPVPAGY